MSVIAEDAAVETPVNGSAEVVTDTVTDVEIPLESPQTETETVVEETVEEAADTQAEEAPADEAKAETPEESAPITFDSAEPDFLEKVDQALGEYDLPAPVAAAFEALKAKATAPSDAFAPYAAYAPENAPPEEVETTVKTLLDRVALLDSAEVDDAGSVRPHTDKFAQEFQAVNPQKAAWLAYDMMRLPSEKYQGINKFEEGIVDATRQPNDSPQAALARYHQVIDVLKNGAELPNSMPTFIPMELRDAFWSLPKEDREEFETYSPDLDRLERDDYGRLIYDDAAIRNRKLTMLAQIQKGIEGDKMIAQQQANDVATRQQNFNTGVQTTLETVYTAFRKTVTEDVIKNVKFSDNPKLNVVLANQNVSMLAEALDPGAAGELARTTLAEAGVKFDLPHAIQLQKDLELASIALETAKQNKDAQGNILDTTAMNKANDQLRRAVSAFSTFAKNILDQEARLVATGTAEDVTKAVEKKKIAPKARAATAGAGSKATAKPAQSPHAYGTPEYYSWWADQEIQRREAQKARAYQ